MQQTKERFDKLVVAARYWLLGMVEHDEEYFKVITALEAAQGHHNGTRNGGAPAFIHQLEIFHNLRCFHKHINNPVNVYTLSFLHDMLEDSNKDKAFITPADLEKWFGEEILVKTSLLSKQILGVDNPHYKLQNIFLDEDTSLVKAADRNNNVSSMVGVFKPERLKRYVDETMNEFIPNIKMARRLFPRQEAVYESIKRELLNQIELINHLEHEDDF